MTEHRNEHRRPNLATIVGSGLAVVAAGSLLAFSSLAEQAGLQGLATGGISPTVPARGDTTRAIRLPEPASDGRPVDPIDEIVRDAIARANVQKAAPRTTPAAGPSEDMTTREKTEPVRKPRPDKRNGDGGGSRGVALAARTTGTGETSPVATAEPAEGPPYGNAHGHDKHDKAGKAKPGKAAQKHGGKDKPHDPGPSAPVYAKSHGKNDEASDWKPKKLKPKEMKAPKAGKSNGHGNGHSKHAHDNGKGKSKGKGHSKKH